MNILILMIMVAGLLGGPAAGRLEGQETRRLTLSEAVAEARESSPQVAEAEARADGARQQVTAAGASRWPSLGLEAGVMRSTDPVAVFGTRMRQTAFTQADFDPARLNRPDPLTDWDAALALGWAPVDFSRDAALAAARAGADAAELGAEWTRRVAAYQAEVRYVEAVGAEILLQSAEAAVSAAEADLERISDRASEGVVTQADVLQARAALEQARARLITTEQGVADARARLGLALGWPTDVVPVPTSDALDLGAGAPASDGPTDRADLAASAAGVRAAEETVRQAERFRLPKIQGFARLEGHTNTDFDPRGDSWTVGLRVSVPLFTGFEIGARARAARAEAEALSVAHEQRVREARVELDATRRGAEARRRAAMAAEAAQAAAEEAARLLRRRYEEGLATTAELLAAEAASVQSRTAAVQARLDHRIAVAGLLLLDDSQLDANTAEGVDR